MALKWSVDSLIPSAGNAYGLSASPALAVYKNVLYCVRQGRSDSGWTWCGSKGGGTGWSTDKLIRNDDNAYGISSSPALVVYKDKLYCFHQGRSDSGWLWYATFDGKTWSNDQQVKDASGNGYGLSESPAVAVYNGLLYCVRQGRSDSGWTWCATFDGTSWSKDKLIRSDSDAYGISGSPALAVYDGLLYCIRQGRSDSGWTWCATFDGTTWSKDKLIKSDANAYGLSDSPALAVFDGKLYCVRQGRGDSGWTWCATFDGTTWSDDQLIPDAGNAYGLSASPALAEYGGTLYCARQGRSDSGWTWCGTLPFGTITDPVELLDVWGEGRISTGGVVSGFVQARNLNKIGQMVSNGPSASGAIPNLVPVSDYNNPTFPISDGIVQYITLMGAPIVPAVAREMYRVLNKTNGVVLLYNPSAGDRATFEANMGNLVYKPNDPLNAPFNQPSFRPVYIYGFPGVIDHDEL